jgi:hypothetical protein
MHPTVRPTAMQSDFSKLYYFFFVMVDEGKAFRMTEGEKWSKWSSLTDRERCGPCPPQPCRPPPHRREEWAASLRIQTMLGEVKFTERLRRADPKISLLQVCVPSATWFHCPVLHRPSGPTDVEGSPLQGVHAVDSERRIGRRERLPNRGVVDPTFPPPLPAMSPSTGSARLARGYPPALTLGALTTLVLTASGTHNAIAEPTCLLRVGILSGGR